MCIWYNLCMYLILCHVSGKTDLVTPINSVLFCSVLFCVYIPPGTERSYCREFDSKLFLPE